MARPRECDYDAAWAYVSEVEYLKEPSNYRDFEFRILMAGVPTISCRNVFYRFVKEGKIEKSGWRQYKIAKHE